MAYIPRLQVPRAFRRGGKQGDQRSSIESGRWLLDYMASRLGYADLGDVSLLDMGCGVKFTQAILEYDLPLRRYLGIDVYREMIEFLRTRVSDPRFDYQHLNAHNAMYNPQGVPLSECPRLPTGEYRFDLVCLFSVFTHLAPHDYPRMLKLLRPCVEDHGHLFFTLFINEPTEGGCGLADRLARDLPPDTPPQAPPPFLDLDPEQPLRWALYSREYALELIENTGWQVERLLDPLGDNQIQHHFICTPA